MPSLKCLGALVALVLASPASADWVITPDVVTPDACIHIDLMAEYVGLAGGTVKRVPDDKFASALAIYRISPNAGPNKADKAFFDEFPDGSGGIHYARGTCVTTIWVKPGSPAKSQFTDLLYGE